MEVPASLIQDVGTWRPDIVASDHDSASSPDGCTPHDEAGSEKVTWMHHGCSDKYLPMGKYPTSICKAGSCNFQGDTSTPPLNVHDYT